jgi:hypothetical protein
MVELLLLQTMIFLEVEQEVKVMTKKKMDKPRRQLELE